MAKSIGSIDLRAIGAQFSGLQGRHPGLWPLAPRVALLVGLLVAVLGLAWAGYWRDQLAELEAGQDREVKLKAEYADKLRQAVNLDVLRAQKEQVSVYVDQLEKQLPSKAEMDALLSDINQAGVGRGLQFELFKPGQVVLREFYAELPINIRLVGGFHDLGAFTSDISNLARIVTLNDMHIQLNDKTGLLTMDAVAKTFRYLDADEIAEARKQAQQARLAEAKAGKGGKRSAAKGGGK
ncbi:type 4a pilus biogenesis protein PilO [Quisquiliibacterium transsilvanicum]|uniref:Type IV pilus assembly protein PilO n=1 Tax=Quisquiliibacterium transsilvanicum TaxID=1549638 RepID=A0A7W8HH16_9BURK|nr:type 4a pilus biogenesis protein PilO [Quisquiliibacterium transsilvanicum]MBB5271850.1 type IV pilus assembly protein PilO [Quisquiliibacterium transsilvanicum]